jgi:D-alanyl-D-alanine carboxypeptidase
MKRALLALVLLVAVGGGAFAYLRDDDAPAPARPTAQAPPASLEESGTAPLAGGGTAPSPLAVRLDLPTDNIKIKFKKPPRSALVFDLDTGRVLWRREPTKVLPIASLTKMMTALVVADRVPPGSKVKITKEALRYEGSGVGMLPRGKWIGVNTMLYGLMLPSGNDAAIALAQRAAKGSVKRFVRYMNERAERMGLVCTHFSTPSGFEDKDNHSCAADQAAIARAVLREPRLARIVRKREAIVPFPIKGGKLYLYNHNPLLRQGYPGTTGLKTGYTDAAGRCLVATARRGAVKLGVVLLDSPDPGKQAMQLLDRGFASLNARVTG